VIVDLEEVRDLGISAKSRRAEGTLTFDHICHKLFGIASCIEELQPSLERYTFMCLALQARIGGQDKVAKVGVCSEADTVACVDDKG
jgi:hypothetical protein